MHTRKHCRSLARACAALPALVLATACWAHQAPADAHSPILPLRNPIPGANALTGLPDGAVTTLSLDDLPPWSRAIYDEDLRADRIGYKMVDDQVVGDVLGRYRDVLEPAAPDVPATSMSGIDLQRSDLARLRYLGRIPGLRLDRQLLSATLVFERADQVPLFLEEFRFADAPGGAILMMRELLNAQVGAHPARVVIQKTRSGLSRSVLIWAAGGTEYRLSVFDDVDVPRAQHWNRAWLLGLAASLGT